MLLEHERNYGLGMDALVAVCSWNTDGIMVWACILWSPYALETPKGLWFGHGCSGRHMLLKHKGNYGLAMDALVIECSWNTNGIMVWAWMLWSPRVQHEECSGYSQPSTSGPILSLCADDSSPETLYGSVAAQGL